MEKTTPILDLFWLKSRRNRNRNVICSWRWMRWYQWLYRVIQKYNIIFEENKRRVCVKNFWFTSKAKIKKRRLSWVTKELISFTHVSSFTQFQIERLSWVQKISQVSNCDWPVFTCKFKKNYITKRLKKD